MAPLSINAYHSLCKEVFQLLLEDAGILFNPFNFPKLEAVTEAREAFTPAEIKLIRDNLDDFTRPLFSMAVFGFARNSNTQETGGQNAVCFRKGFALVQAHFLLLCGLARHSPCHCSVNRRSHVAGNDKALYGAFNDGSKARVHGADVRLYWRGGGGTNFELL